MPYEKVAFSPMWDFEADRTLEGWYIGKKEAIGENHSNVYQIELDTGETTEFWGSTVLDGQFDHIKLGSRVKIDYLGLEDSPNRKGKQYKNYDVFIDKDLVKEGF
mgnify:FL=1